MNTWFWHFEELCKELGVEFDYICSTDPRDITPDVDKYMETNDAVLLIGRDADWWSLKDTPYAKWFYMHNSYQYYGTDIHAYTAEPRTVLYSEFLASLDNFIVVNRMMQKSYGGVYLPQPYMRTNTNKHLERNGLLVVAHPHPIKRTEAVSNLTGVTVLEDATPTEVAEAMQTHKALIMNSLGEASPYVALEANGVIPIYVNSDTDWHNNTDIQMKAIEMTADNLTDIRYVAPKEDTYRNYVTEMWRDWFKENL